MNYRPVYLPDGLRLVAMPLLALALIAPSASQGQAGRDLYLRAPDVLPGVVPAMRETAYWVDRMERPDEHVLAPSEIENLNRRFQARMKNVDALDAATAERIRGQLAASPGLVAAMPDLDSMSAAERSALVREVVERQIQYLRRRPFGNRLGIEYTAGELEAIEAELAIDVVGSGNERATGILVQSARLRIIPPIRPEFTGLTQVGKSRWDLWNLDVVPVGTEVRVLHRSKTGSFLLVLSARGFGWIEAENVALASEAMIRAFTQATPFVVTTGDRVPFYSGADSLYVSGWLRMGDRLPLAADEDERRVLVPVRRINGELSVEQAWLAPDADVHTGYLPYTRRNVVVQAFKLLDNVYDWTGGWLGRNHATVLRDVFGTFGFDLPGNGVLLSLYSEKTETLAADLDRDAKISRIAAHEPFFTIGTSDNGHTQLYLGQMGGQVFVFDTHGYGYPNENGETLEIRRCVVGTLDLPAYMLRQDLTLTELR